MKLQATVVQLVEDGDELSVTMRGWADTDAPGTYSRPLGTIKVPSNVRNRRSYYIGRRLTIEVKPS
jgi:hypothetical protein